MNENENKNFENSGGEITGFDSVDKTENTANEQQGYTVTPEGGFYSKPREEIIQDTVSPADSVNSENADFNKTQDPKTDYKPNGTYGSYSAYSNNYSQDNNPQNNQNQSTDSINQENSANNTAPNYYNNNPVNSYYSNKKPPKPKKEKKKKEGGKYSGAMIAVASVLAVIIGAFSGGLTAIIVSDNSSTPILDNSANENKSNVNINIDKNVESVVEAVASKVTPSVVGIRTITSVTSFFGGNSESKGEGSGIIYTTDGYIITNYHVIESAAASSSKSKIEVFLNNDLSKSYPATVVGYNISSDLAVIKIDVKGLTPIELADSSKLSVGQYVITVGSPGGLEFMGSVTYGVISGLDRVISSASSVSLIQTDAAINPGNSGGALVNTSGQLVGVNSSKIVAEEFEGMGFAIPVNTAIEICKSIISKENQPEPYIGITVSEKYTPEVLEYYGYPLGAVVLMVDSSSPAEKAGIKRGDIITEFNGKKITDFTLLNDYINECKPNQSVDVKLYRSGRDYTTTIKVASNNAQ